MPAKTKITNDHATIKQWAEERNGSPSTVKETLQDDQAGILRINFPGYAEDGLRNITWKTFFKKFDENDLYFVYQEETESGNLSRFGKFISGTDAEEKFLNKNESNLWMIFGAAIAGFAIGATATHLLFFRNNNSSETQL